jgi:tetratricopeptide (TPR) repeat protein
MRSRSWPGCIHAIIVESHCNSATMIQRNQQSAARSGCAWLAWPYGVLFIWLLFLPSPAWSVPQTHSNHLQESVALMSRGDLEGAEQEARLALRDPSTRALAWASLGTIRVEQKKYDEGVEFLATALRLSPRLVGARISLGDVYLLQGKKDKAREMFREALRIDPENHSARFGLAQVESASGNFGASLEAAAPVLPDLRRSAGGILLLAADYAGLKRTDSLRVLVPDWEQLPQVSVTSCTDFASLLAKNGLVQEALEVLEKAKSDGEASYDLALALANLQFWKGDLAKASQSYEAALGLKQDCVLCLRQIAKIAEQQKDFEKALGYLIRAKRLQPEDPEILFELGKACLEMDLFDDSIAALQQAVELQPENDSFRYVLGSARVSKKQYKEAEALFATLLKRRPNDGVLNYAMGSVLFLDVQPDQAERYLQKSIEVQPNQSGAYYYLGLVAEGRGEEDRATGILQDVVRRYPDYGPAYEALGRIWLKERKFTEAQQALEKAILLDPSSAKAHYQLGMLLGRIGKREDGDKELEIAQKLEAEERERLGMHLRIVTPH